MSKVMQIIQAGVLASAVLMVAVAGSQAEPIKMRISVDSAAQNIRVKILNDYIAAVNAKVGDRLEIELFHSSQLFNDRDAIKATHQGAIQMSTPSTSLLSSVETNFNAALLPVFYGVDVQEMRDFADGELGRELNESLEAKLDVKILGPWLEMASAHLYSVAGKPMNTYKDLEGMTIRTPGGAGNDLRLAFFKANVVNIPWPDVPLALSQGKIDAIFTLHGSLAAGKMWESGVKYCFEDYGAGAHYVPMINRSFWDQLPADLQTVLTDTWLEQVPAQRVAMAAAQAEARDTLIANGVKIVTPDLSARAAVREEMLKSYDQWVEALGIDRDFAERVRQAFGTSH